MILDSTTVSQYQGLIFDMDGTLIDSITCYTKVWIKVGKLIGSPSQSDIMYQLTGSSVHNIVRKMMKQCGVQVSEHQLGDTIQFKRRIGREILENETQLLPAFDVFDTFFCKIPPHLARVHRVI